MISKDNLKSVEALTHDEARRRHIQTAECQSVMKKEEEAPIRVAYGRAATGRCRLRPRLAARKGGTEQI